LKPVTYLQKSVHEPVAHHQGRKSGVQGLPCQLAKQALHSSRLFSQEIFMAKLSLIEVETIAELAKLSLTDAEKATFQEQLSAILDYAEMLQRVDTTNIPPTASAIPLSNVMRLDEVALSLSNEEALFNAPESEDGSFKVQAVLE
jgi:aspartyl-tRNA(Asn)/glutamyl-tRNA(Gln) amidotransferase subunit C